MASSERNSGTARRRLPEWVHCECHHPKTHYCLIFPSLGARTEACFSKESARELVVAVRKQGVISRALAKRLLKQVEGFENLPMFEHTLFLGEIVSGITSASEVEPSELAELNHVPERYIH